jgi:F-type H+-transporting ATPase subunit b
MLYEAEFWVAVGFFLFVGVLLYMKVPGLLSKSLDERADTIRKELDEARRLREEAQDLLADYQRKQREADAEAQAIIDGARKEAEAMKVETEKALKESLARRSRVAEDKIARAEAQAVAEVRAAAVDAAAAAAERIVKGRVAGPAGPSLVDQAIRDLRGKRN